MKISFRGWKNNLGLKIAALIFAALLWWVVVNVDDPVDTEKYHTQVSLVNTGAVTDHGMSYEVLDNTDSVTVTVKARRKVLSKIKTSDIRATADFGELRDSSVPVRVTVTGFEGEYNDATANPRNLRIKTEVTEMKSFDLSLETVGELKTGHILDADQTVINPASVNITGPNSALSRVQRVAARVNVAGLSSDKTLPAQLIYYDASGKEIEDKKTLSAINGPSDVTVDVKLLISKEVPIIFDTSRITPKSGYIFAGLEIEPQRIEVAGTASVMSQISQISVGADALFQSDLEANVDLAVNITPYLPRGVRLVNESSANIAVKILIERPSTKRIQLHINKSMIRNLASDFEPEILDSSVYLEFEGTNEALSQISEAYLASRVEIDLSQYNSGGNYTVTLRVSGLPENCRLTGDVTVRVRLTDRSPD